MTPRTSLPVLLMLTLSACGGGGGGGGGTSSPPPVGTQPPATQVPVPVVPSPTPLPVVPPAPVPTTPPVPAEPFAAPSFDPVTGSSGVARTASVTATFGANLATASVNADKVALLAPGGAQLPAAFTVTGSQLKLTSATALPGDTTYTIRLAAGFADAAGRTLSAPARVSFTTVAQAWSENPAVVQTLPKDSPYTYPAVVSDRSGNLIATWQLGAGANTVFAARFDATAGKWSAPAVAIRATDAGIHAGQLVANSNGDVFQYWIEQASGDPKPVPDQLRQARFDSATSTWTGPATLALLPAGLTVESLRVFADQNGGQIALMTNSSQFTPAGLYAARLDGAGGSWGSAQRIDRPGTSGRVPYSYSAAADKAGNILATWMDSANDVRNLMSARFDVATGQWGAPVVIAENVGDGGGRGTLAVDPAGAALAIWVDRAATLGQWAAVRVARFDPALRTWSSGQRIDTAFYATAFPQILLDASGYATATWLQQPYKLEVVSARLDPATSQSSTPKTLSTGGAVQAIEPKIAMDVAGNVIVAFIEEKAMKAVRYRSSDKSWGSATPIGQPPSGWEKAILAPSLVIDASGVATVVWARTNERSLGVSPIFDNEIVANQFR